MADLLWWECPECDRVVGECPCPRCGCGDVVAVWSDGQVTDPVDTPHEVVQG